MAGESPATYGTQQQILKEIYGGVNMISQQRRRSYDLFTKSKRPIAGKYWVTADHMTGGNGSVGTRPDNVELPPAQQEVYANGKVFDRFHYAGFQYTGPVIRHAKDNVSAFVNLITSEIENKTRWLIDMLNIQMYQDSYGVLGTVNSDSYGGGAMTLVTSPINSLWIRKGVRFDVYKSTFKTNGTKVITTDKHNESVGATRAGLAVSTFNPATGAILCAASLDWSTPIVPTDVMVLEDICGALGNSAGDSAFASGSNGGAGTGLSGLELMIDDGTNALSYQSISRTDYPEYKAGVLSNSGVNRPMTLDLLQKLEDTIRINSQEEPDTIISGLGQRRNLLALGLPDVRFQAEAIKLGFVGSLTFNGREWIVDEICPPNRTYMMKRQDNIHKYESLPMGPLDDDVAPARQRIVGFDKYEGYIANYFNIGCDRPNACAKLIDLNEPS
jgi:hypothetical protein